MAFLAISMALLGAVLAVLPAPAFYLGLGLGIAALTFGWSAYRPGAGPGAHRLLGAAAIAVGGIAIALALLRVALILKAIATIEGLLRSLV